MSTREELGATLRAVMEKIGEAQGIAAAAGNEAGLASNSLGAASEGSNAELLTDALVVMAAGSESLDNAFASFVLANKKIAAYIAALQL